MMSALLTGMFLHYNTDKDFRNIYRKIFKHLKLVMVMITINAYYYFETFNSEKKYYIIKIA